MRITYFRRRRILMPRFAILHAEKGGGPVLRGEASWRTASGFAINTTRGCLMVELRRAYKVMGVKNPRFVVQRRARQLRESRLEIERDGQ